MASSNCWQAPVSYVIFSEERPKRVACARFHFSRITCICWFVRFNSSVRTASWLRNSFSCSKSSSFCREYLPGCLKTGGSGLLFMWQRRLSTIHVKRIKNRTFYPHTGFRIKQKTSLFCTKVTLDILDRSYGQMDLWSIRS